MARKYYGSFNSINGVVHRVEIWDGPNGTTPEITSRLYASRIQSDGGYQEGQSCVLNALQKLDGSTELTLAGEGYKITRKGEGDPLYENYIRPSRVTSYWVMPNNTVLNDFESISTVTEQYWAILIYKDNVLDYVGRVLADQLSRLRESINSKPIVELVGVDGLELLSGYKVNSSDFTDGKITIAQMFRRALDNLSLKDYWVMNGTNSDYFREASTVYNSSASRKGFDLEEVDLNTFVSNYDQFKDVRATDASQFIYAANDMIDCAAALEQLCEIKQARLIHSQGKYWLIGFADYIDSTITYRTYSYTMQYTGVVGSYSHRQTLGTIQRPQWAAKPTLTHQVAAKYVEIDTQRRLGATIYRGYNNISTAALAHDFTDIPTGTTPDQHPIRVRFNLKFAKAYFTEPITGAVYPEQFVSIQVEVYVQNSSGGFLVLDQNGYWVASGTPGSSLSFNEKVDVTNQSGTWVTYNFDKNVTTAPAGYDTLGVAVICKSVFPIFDKAGRPTTKSASPVDKEFWGAINVAFADSSPYNNPDFTFDIAEIFTPDATSSVNSLPVILHPKYYSSNTKYATGAIRVNNGTSYVLAETNWYGGWDSVTHGTLTETLGHSIAGLYKDFMPVIQGTWIDSGSLTAIKSLYFDGYTWILQGCEYSARMDQWSGEWVAIIPTYSAVTSSGEGYKVGTGLTDRVNYLDMQVSSINDQIQGMSNSIKQTLANDVNGSPTSVPTQTTQYEVMLQFDATQNIMDWKLQEHGTFKTYNAGTHTLDQAYEGHELQCSSGNVIINLPSVATQKGKKYYFIKLGSAHIGSIYAASGETINGATHIDLNTNYLSHTLICDGSTWLVIADTGGGGGGGGGSTNWGDIGGVLSNQTDLQAALNAKQALLGYTPEDSANKSVSVTTDSTSNTKYPSVKAVYDWAVSAFQTALGFTPENSANKSTSVVTDQASTVKYPTVKSLYDWATGLFATISTVSGKQDTLVSGTNIKTINSTPVLGSGDIVVQPTLVSGTNIKTLNSNSLLGSGNLAVQALPSGVSTAYGDTALSSITTGANNTAIGYQALKAAQGGSQNTALGTSALTALISGTANIALGYRAMAALTTNTDNIAIGDRAMEAGNGGGNVFIGSLSGQVSSTNCDQNTAVGYQALKIISTGNRNVAIGGTAGNALTTGASNVLIGYNAQAGAGNSASIVLGRNAAATANNQFVVGSSAYNAGTVTTEVNASSKVWNVIINGTACKILLA